MSLVTTVVVPVRSVEMAVWVVGVEVKAF